MNHSKNVDKFVKISEKTRHGGLPKSRDGRTMVNLVRPPHDNPTGPTVTSKKRTRGRPVLSRPDNVDVPKKDASGKPCNNIGQGSKKGEQKIYPRSSQKSSKNEELMISTDSAEDVEIAEKKGRGRPPLRKRGREDAEVIITRGRGRPLGSTKNKIRETFSKPSTSFLVQKRGRPRKTKLLLLNKTSDVPQTKTLTVRVMKMKADAHIMAKEKLNDVEKNDPTETRKNVEEDNVGLKTLPSVEKSRVGEKRRMVVSLTDITEHDKEPVEVAVVAEKKRRGRPRKCQSDVVENGEQMPHEGYCLSVKCEEGMDEESLPQTDVQTSQEPEWEKNPIHEDGVDLQDTNSVTQWVLEDSSASQPPHPQETEQLHFQQVLLKELSEFRSQATRELEAARAEVREGAELVRSAIAGVSAEIHRLSLILQPLVDIFSAANLFAQQSTCAPVTSLLCPQQDMPSEGTRDAPQLPTQPIDTSTSPNGETSSFHVPSHDTHIQSSAKSLPDDTCLVKKEDLSESEGLLLGDKPAAQSLFLPHLDLPKVFSTRPFHKTTSSGIPDTHANVSATHLTSSVDRPKMISDVTHTILVPGTSGSPQDSSSQASSHNVMDRSYPSKPISFGVSSDRCSPASTSALYYNQDQSTIRSPQENSYQPKPGNLQVENPCPNYSKRGHHQSSGDSLEHAGCTLADSNPLLCQVEDTSLPILTTPFVTLSQSFISNPSLMSVDQVMNFEGTSSKQNSFQISQDFPEMSHSAEIPIFTQSTSALSQVCAEMPQPRPSSLLSHTDLLQSESDFTQMLQGAAD